MKVTSQSSRRERMTDVMKKKNVADDSRLEADENFKAKVTRGVNQIRQGRSVPLEELAERLEVRKSSSMEAAASIA